MITVSKTNPGFAINGCPISSKDETIIQMNELCIGQDIPLRKYRQSGSNGMMFCVAEIYFITF